MSPKWDKEAGVFGNRSYLSSKDILDSVRDTGKVLIPSNDFIFPSERAMSETYQWRNYLDRELPFIDDAFETREEADKYLAMIRRRMGLVKGTMDSVSDATWDVAQTYEPKMYQALSEGIRNTYGFKPHHKIQDISKELAYSMGVPNVPIEFKYMEGVGGATNGKKILLNPQYLNDFGKEAVLAHELRHLKPGEFSGPTLGKINSLDPLLGLRDALAQESLLKSKQGKDLQQFVKGGGFKDKLDALDIVSFFEGKHFANPFIKENLKRVSKGLPVVGAAATILGVGSYSDPSSAAVDMIMPGGLEELGGNEDNEIMADRKYRSANLIPNVRMLGDYTDAPDTGRYHESIRKLQGRKK